MELPPGYQLAGLLVAMPTTPGSPTIPHRFRCVGVPDGDGLVISHTEADFQVRLYGIDAPEIGQQFGIDAKQFLASRVFGMDVSIATLGEDIYKRSIARVLDPDGRDMSCELVHRGLAWHFKKYAPYDSVLEFLQEDAKKARRGLWSKPNPIPPWTWRESH